MHGIRDMFFRILIIVFALSACTDQATPTQSTSVPTQALQQATAQASQPEPRLAPTLAIEPELTQPLTQVPLTEAEVPRVTIQDAKAAFDRGEAIIVDVRGADAYQVSHIAGAINIQLGEFETNPTGLDLDKDQWIITYCT